MTFEHLLFSILLDIQSVCKFVFGSIHEQYTSRVTSFYGNFNDAIIYGYFFAISDNNRISGVLTFIFDDTFDEEIAFDLVRSIRLIDTYETDTEIAAEGYTQEYSEISVLIHDDENVEITFLGVEVDNRDREQLVFFVENKTDVELTLSIDGMSLGHISGSESIAAQSRGFIRFRAAEDFPNRSPSAVSGTITVIDFGRTLWVRQSYEVTFVNVGTGVDPVNHADSYDLPNLLIHEDDYVAVFYVGIELDNRNQEQLVFLVDNKTDAEITFQSGSISLDGFSLGRVSGSNSIAAQSRGFIRFRTTEDFPSHSPSTISGTITVIDFGRTLWARQSYEITFVNVEVN